MRKGLQVLLWSVGYVTFVALMVMATLTFTHVFTNRPGVTGASDYSTATLADPAATERSSHRRLFESKL